MNYKITGRPINRIISFYKNVAKKYKHTYSSELMVKNINEAINDMYRIENGLPRRIPRIQRWSGYFMANTPKWYYAYIVNGDTITIVDACHSQNMKESIKLTHKLVLKENELRNIIKESIKKILNMI